MQYQSHALADLFPLIEGAEFDELVASIKAHGLREPITLYNNLILDGRNRYRACEVAEVEPRFEEFTGDDPYAFVADKNLHRRHLKPTQLGMIGARMATMKVGNPHLQSSIGEISPIKNPSIDNVAKMLNINRSTVTFAKKVLNEGTQEEINAVDRGEAAVSTIAKQIKARIPEEKRVLKNHSQHDSKRANAKIWNNLRSAFELLSSMPRPSDAVRLARGYGAQSGIIDERLAQTVDWLNEFQTAWASKKKDAA